MFQNLRINLISRMVELNERLIFDKRLIKYYKQELPYAPKTIIDVGVNTGQSIEIFKKINDQCSIFGFEPNTELFQGLKTKYAKEPNIRLYNLGISDHEGSRRFHENVLHSTSTFEELNFESDYLSRKAKMLGIQKEDIIRKSYDVQITTLSNFINANVHTPIDILKIDTEGHEYYCLEGLFLSKLNVEVNYIQIEEHNDDMYLNKKSFADIKQLLDLNGYKVHHTIRHGFGDFMEVIFKRVK